MKNILIYAIGMLYCLIELYGLFSNAQSIYMTTYQVSFGLLIAFLAIVISNLGDYKHFKFILIGSIVIGLSIFVALALKDFSLANFLIIGLGFGFYAWIYFISYFAHKFKINNVFKVFLLVMLGISALSTLISLSYVLSSIETSTTNQQTKTSQKEYKEIIGIWKLQSLDRQSKELGLRPLHRTDSSITGYKVVWLQADVKVLDIKKNKIFKITSAKTVNAWIKNNTFYFSQGKRVYKILNLKAN
ncbi:MAG: hypothetical protein COA44_04620 [Arcobacter sp.]|nr:MAG: hypothetical protein COA44_04620 [Arcobacter sp.]